MQIAEFQEHTKRDLGKVLKKLEGQGMEGLIIDLRNNPGGLLTVAVEVADFFLPEGKLIVSTKGKNSAQNLIFKSHKSSAHLDYPIVILINEGSASGSEILAGALRDNKRALLVGAKTFGKGSVQTIIPLSDGSAVRLTTSKYYLPGGQSIHEEGIMPDIEVDEEEYVAIKHEEVDVFEQIEKEPQAKIELEKEQEEEYDIQLERAIDLIKGIIVYQDLTSIQESP